MRARAGGAAALARSMRGGHFRQPLTSAAVAARADKLPLDNSDDDGDGEEGDDDDGRVHQDRERRKARRTRYMSLASKMRVDQILEKIRIDTRIDFDYVSFLVISSVLAVVGLSTNSAPTIVASMLISPIMGPVLAMAIAANVQKPKLFRLGVYNYILTLAVCIVVGFVVRAQQGVAALGRVGVTHCKMRCAARPWTAARSLAGRLSGHAVAVSRLRLADARDAGARQPTKRTHVAAAGRHHRHLLRRGRGAVCAVAKLVQPCWRCHLGCAASAQGRHGHDLGGSAHAVQAQVRCSPVCPLRLQRCSCGLSFATFALFIMCTQARLRTLGTFVVRDAHGQPG